MPTRPLEREEGTNGDDEPFTALSDRQLLQRVDTRSLEVRHGLDAIGRDVIRLTAQQAALTTSLSDVRGDIRRLEGSIRDLRGSLTHVQRSADDSGERLQEEITELHSKAEELEVQLREKEREERESKLAAAQKEVDELKVEKARELAETRKRRRDLSWRIVEAILVAATAAAIGHFGWK